MESDFSNEAAYVATNSTVATAPAYQSPTLDPLSNLNINENSGAQSIALNGISLGSGSMTILGSTFSTTEIALGIGAVVIIYLLTEG